jgi:hypothetical protein
MSNGGAAAGASAAAAAHHAKVMAIKAMGPIVKVDSQEFIKIINGADSSLVVFAKGGFFNSKFRYLTSYRGLYFFTQSSEKLNLPGKAEVVAAEKIWVP